MGFTHRKHCSFIAPLCSTNANLTNPTCASYYTHVIILYINSFSISKLNLIFAVR